MKRWLLLIFAVLLVLSGCDGEPVPETTAPTTAQTVETTERIPGPSLYVPGSKMEQNTQGAVLAYLPETGSASTFGFMGEDPVLFSWWEDTYFATRIDADTGEILAQETLPGTVDLWSGVGLGPDRFVCFDIEANLFRVYDGQLRAVDTVPLPEEITGTILFSQDLSTAYYGVNGTLVAHDLHTGISRLILRTDGAEVYPSAVLFGDTVAACYINSPEDAYDAFFSLADGRMLARENNYVYMETAGDFYVAQCADGPMSETLMGRRNGEVKSFQTENYFANLTLLGRSGRLAEPVSREEGIWLRLYEADRGNCLGQILLPETLWVGTILEDAQGRLWFMAMDEETETDMLCRWDPADAEGSDSLERIGQRYTLDNPDLEGLALCRKRAQTIGDFYGVEICLYKDPVEPFDYTFVPEHQILAITAGLDAVETALGMFPEGFFRTAASVTESGRFHINLVREMVGTEYNTVADATGLHYWIDGESYITLLAWEGVEQDFYHELCHALETYVIANSIHYDFWEDNNPEDFTYDYSYTEYTERWDSPWLAEETRAFIDSYSMTYPIEDRARILEYAMMEGNESYFTTDTMQAKLKQLCMAIREAFGWEKSQEAFLWEQYLQEPLQHK